MLLQRVQFVPHDHLWRRGDALSPAQQENEKSKKTSLNSSVIFKSTTIEKTAGGERKKKELLN